MKQQRVIFFVAGLATTGLLAGCQRSDRPSGQASNAVNLRHSDANVMIRTTDGAMNMGLANDTVFLGLSDSVLTEARKDMARDTEETSNAFAGAIERMVKKSVGSALKTRLKYPLADIDSVWYSGGAIKFAYRNKRLIPFEGVSQNGHQALQSFTPEDAQLFVATVDSAIHTIRGTSR